MKQNILPLTASFLSGIFTVEVFLHLFSDGMRPGGGSQGDITGFLAPVFIILSSSILGFSSAQEKYNRIKVHLFNLLFEFLTLFFWMTVTYIYPDRYFKVFWTRDPSNLISIYFAYLFPFLLCYAAFCLLGKIPWLMEKTWRRVLLTVLIFYPAYFFVFSLFIWAVWIF